MKTVPKNLHEAPVMVRMMYHVGVEDQEGCWSALCGARGQDAYLVYAAYKFMEMIEYDDRHQHERTGPYRWPVTCPDCRNHEDFDMALLALS